MTLKTSFLTIKKDPRKDEKTKNEIAKRKANRPDKNPFNFKFWEWMG